MRAEKEDIWAVEVVARENQVGGGGGLSPQGKDVTSMGARIMFNAAKQSDVLRSKIAVKIDRDLEKSAQSQDLSFINKINSEKEARRVSEYYKDRETVLRKKIVNLGSAEKLHENQKLAKEYRNIRNANNTARDNMKKFSKKIEAGNTNIHDTSRTTTTYDRARKRRMSQFDDWFFGSSKK